MNEMPFYHLAEFTCGKLRHNSFVYRAKAHSVHCLKVPYSLLYQYIDVEYIIPANQTYLYAKLDVPCSQIVVLTPEGLQSQLPHALRIQVACVCLSPRAKRSFNGDPYTGHKYPSDDFGGQEDKPCNCMH